MKVLVAGVGNIFFGDDGFGAEVAQRMTRRVQPAGVTVVDFGIRCYDLALSLAEPWDAVIVVDAMRRGESPGTLYVVEPTGATAPSTIDPHALDLTAVLAGARTRVVACEPASFDPELGLSPAVEGAVEPAIALVDRLVAEVLARA